MDLSRFRGSRVPPAVGNFLFESHREHPPAVPGYRIVGPGIRELDYPKGNDNVYTSYAGTCRIPLDSLRRRVLFAWTQPL